ncbi:hypothetical protein HZU77_007015 [Neisseriaceae bacterium TC5R-5]|nr:hypothetical protein [Neisseriaceae bacterium TC5R-5]
MAKAKAPQWLGQLKGHVGEAKSRFAQDKREREAAELSPKSIILTKLEVQGEWDASRVLMTTLDGKVRPITLADLAAFRHNMDMARHRFKGTGGMTARQVIDFAASKPLAYTSLNPQASAGSDIDKARKEITRAIPVSANNGTVRFITNAGKGSKVSRHHVVVVLYGFEEAARQLSSSTLQDRHAAKRLANWLRKQRLAFDCDCERHRYFLRYVATLGGFAAGRKELGFPKIRNPGLKGVACKHVLRVMTELESATTVLTFLQRHLEKVQASADNTAKLQVTQKEADALAAKKGSGRKIKTSAERQAEANKAKEARAAKAAASGASRLKQRKPPATRQLEKALKDGTISKEDLIAALKSQMSVDDIMQALKGA